VTPSGRADAPARSAAQRLDALRRANEVRIGRAQLKKNLASGGIPITDILATPPACARTQKVDDLLLALPRFGPVRVARLLAYCRISPSKTVAGLSDRQRADLIDRSEAPTQALQRATRVAVCWNSDRQHSSSPRTAFVVERVPGGEGRRRGRA
jgi:hypothetical protein